MYEEMDAYMDDIFGILIMVKAVYDATGDVIATRLNEDYFFDAYMTAIDSVAENLDYGTIMDYDNVNKYSFPCMDEYYNLCKEYGKKNKVSFKNNPYVKKAQGEVYSEMESVYSYCMSWALFTPKKKTKKRYNCIYVQTDPEFNQHVSLVVALSEIRTFYDEGVKELKEILKPSNPKIKLLPKKEREKAA